ncbi:Metallo-dependent phosphatase [Sporormia fimetaria CBS 119925]|uniref:Metallo-dependent phosphatase n=1 Tax=Sporormia fimetaria CBS 119925 TaxID=1340428 RepID=A0A6A6VQB2_9PLEO|nr:Metallo-dependent phosphatase [Sporormia fimetaria CBS 119925]
MARRIVRTGLQLGLLVTAVFFIVFFLDSRYRVLPQSIHSHLPLHHEGLIITDITIKSCSKLNPLSKCKLDPEIWHRIEKDVFIKNRWSEAYVHVQRKREEELGENDKVVIDVKIGKLDPAIGEKSQANERWESRPAGIWLKRSSKRHASDSKRTVTAVDILFGADAAEPRPGWEMVKPGALLVSNSGDEWEPHLSIRRGSPAKIEKPVPRINKDGKFKILQLSDLHLSTGVGKCRDPEPNSGHCEADPRTLEFVAKLLDNEKPDFVVLSGDQVNGDTAPDGQTALFKIAALLSEHKTPYAAIFGNHDDEGSLSRAAQISLYESLPYSLATAGPNSIAGIGNYYVEVLAHGNNKHSALTLWFLDTHSYSPDEKHFTGYDWLKDDQIKWFNDEATRLKDLHKNYAKIHLDMAFLHIPLPEYGIRGQKVVGNWKEGITAPKFNSHFKDALVKQGIRTVSAGHDHVNDYCALSVTEREEPELWMCYAGGAGFGGYGGYNGYVRRARVWEVDAEQARIVTWKRVESGEVDKRIDEQIVVDGGRVVEGGS